MNTIVNTILSKLSSFKILVRETCKNLWGSNVISPSGLSHDSFLSLAAPLALFRLPSFLPMHQQTLPQKSLLRKKKTWQSYSVYQCWVRPYSTVARARPSPLATGIVCIILESFNHIVFKNILFPQIIISTNLELSSGLQRSRDLSLVPLYRFINPQAMAWNMMFSRWLSPCIVRTHVCFIHLWKGGGVKAIL